MALAFPQTFYNDSGLAVAALARRHGIEDPSGSSSSTTSSTCRPGKLKVKVGGGLAGNNGLRSIKFPPARDDFVRVRIGVGKPPGRQDGADHVLRRPGKAERADSTSRSRRRPTPSRLILAEGPEAAMTRFNARA